ncbi:hypothetical protein E2C01_099126 [Portunus trituberculatus]|uniref:Uncharacterized protein n=1 Tax=Portunus trituberculatus TaxID=210409 RepID=A0A5B7K9I0_PORTR|nr:hypothetical protein [Portunus trituberculatus]
MVRAQGNTPVTGRCFTHWRLNCATLSRPSSEGHDTPTQCNTQPTFPQKSKQLSQYQAQKKREASQGQQNMKKRPTSALVPLEN